MGMRLTGGALGLVIHSNIWCLWRRGFSGKWCYQLAKWRCCDVVHLCHGYLRINAYQCIACAARNTMNI
jgi:hypothetical protein